MRIFTLLLSLVFAASAAAQNGPLPLTIQPTSSSMMRSGWTSPVYSKLKWVPDPKSVTTANVEPERKEAGYWPDMQAPGSQQSGVVLLHFVAGTTLFSKGQDNDRALAILEHTFYNTSLVEQMEFVTIVAAASPEGNTADNEVLAASRALAIKEHIMRMFPYLDRDRIVTYSAGEDWNGLKRLIEEDLYVPGREAAMRLLSSPLPGNLLRERLAKISGGETYAYIQEHLFPKLRGGAACLIYFKDQRNQQESTYVRPQPVYQEPVDQSYMPAPPQPRNVYVPAPQTSQQVSQQVVQQPATAAVSTYGTSQQSSATVSPVSPQFSPSPVVAIVPDQPTQHSTPKTQKEIKAEQRAAEEAEKVRIAEDVRAAQAAAEARRAKEAADAKAAAEAAAAAKAAADARAAEEARLVAEEKAAADARAAEEARLAKEVADAKTAEEKRLAEQAAAAAAVKAAEEAKMAEDARLAREAEDKRLAEEAAKMAEDARLAQVAEEKRLADEAKVAAAEKAAADKRLAEEAKVAAATQAAEEKRLAAEARAAKAAEDKRLAEEAKAAAVAKAAEDKRLADEAKAAKEAERIAKMEEAKAAKAAADAEALAAKEAQLQAKATAAADARAAREAEEARLAEDARAAKAAKAAAAEEAKAEKAAAEEMERLAREAEKANREAEKTNARRAEIERKMLDEYGRYNDEWEKEPLFDLKTNLVYDAFATVSLGAEFKVAEKWSIDIPVNYAGWGVSEQRMWRHLIVQPEARYWLKNALGTGHFVGAHFIGGQYNVKFDKDVRGKRYQGTLFGAGLSYGYRYNFGRTSRWALEGTMGLGFASLNHDVFVCVICGGNDELNETGAKQTWLGPTKVGINLIYRIGGTKK